ncbi:MAG: hypothetical protein OC189_05200 [Acinetobacter sp.]|uniref:hypothetical protein n=1 Tax=Acinetobacter sp. TaxID=472 RepID=UPI0025826098|nr:hypothetical protein [Acinetobacter sp.]MDK4791427.1 hypothetical protein [Acinetobacter sp.]
MKNIFFDFLAEHNLTNKSLIKGYNYAEIKQIERLYDIEIKGDFKFFLERIGRCDGGLLGDDPLILYREAWNVRTHFLFQMAFFNDLQEIGAWDFLNKPFVFSLEEETYYYFLQTGSSSEEVYLYNENEEKVSSTGIKFFDYLVDLSKKYELKSNIRKKVPQGELIII